MRLTLKGVHVNLSESVKAEVTTQLFDPLDALYPGDAGEVEVHLADNNGPKGGNDKECRVTVRLPGRPGLHVDQASENFFKSIRLCSDRVDRVFKRELEKRRGGAAYPAP